MQALIDTNVLARMAQPAHAMYSTALMAVEQLQQQRTKLIVAAQSLFELYVVATRPVPQNGFGMTSLEARHEVDHVAALFPVLSEASQTYQAWRNLIDRYTIMGKTAHDARLVALMMTNQVEAILTFNVSDFVRYHEIEVLNPTVVSKSIG